MTQTARSRLLDIYGTSPEKVFVIPHGAADNRVAASSAGQRRPAQGADLGAAGAGQGNRARDRRDGPAPRSRAAASTIRSPARLIRAYWTATARLTGRRSRRGHGTGMWPDRVHFDARFLPAARSASSSARADVVLLPYDSLEQVTSGVLIEAVAAGKPVVSTCFPHAVELLGGGAGLLVGRQDPAGIAARTAACAHRARPLGADEQVFGGSRAAAAVAGGSALLPGARLVAHRRHRPEPRHDPPCCAVPAPAAADR